MIDPAEISTKAKEFEINEAAVQRDYIFGWVIAGFFTVSSLKDEIFLKGGNALRKGYFENTRYSSDLDFGIPNDISEEKLLEEINTVCDFIQDKAGVQFVKERNKVEEKFGASEAPIPGLRVYEVRVYFRDFFISKENQIVLRVSMDITRFDKVILPLQECQLIHPYSDAHEVTRPIKCMKLEEIIATKLKCLLQRQHAPDLFDYVYSIRLLGGELNKDEVVRTFIQKTIFRNNPRVLKEILHKTAFDYFKEYWNKTLICAKQIFFTAEDAIEFFLADLENLFSPFGDTGYRDFAFFGPDLRVPMMKAGREQTMLKIVYNGAERMVEPYALKYMEKRTGEAKEYFYVYNVSGGNSAPGIRSLVASGFQSIENTEVKFSPRNPIELCKAGEFPENRYLFDPHKPATASSRPRSIFGTRRHRVRSGPTYVYRCAYCGKQISKKTQSSTIGAHKSKGSDYPCPGRAGYYVTTNY